MTKGLENIIKELTELGITERKIVNYLKKIKEEFVEEDAASSSTNDKMYNRLINSMIFDGEYHIGTPTTPLLGMIKNIKKAKGSEFTYYCLSNLIGEYLHDGIYEKTDTEKSNLLMWHIRERANKLWLDFLSSKEKIKEPFGGYYGLEEEE